MSVQQVLPLRRLLVPSVPVPAAPAPAAPAPRRRAAALGGVCACRYAEGKACKLLDGRAGDVPRTVGEHMMRGGTDVGCPGRRV